MKKKTLAISLDEDLIKELKKEASDLRISLSSYITIMLVKRVK